MINLNEKPKQDLEKMKQNLEKILMIEKPKHHSEKIILD